MKKIPNRPAGFTLLEMMIALALFAILATMGWQIFDNLNRTRDRAKLHVADLAQIQYAYLQIQQDLAQTAPYLTASQAKEKPDPQNPTDQNDSQNNENKDKSSELVTPLIDIQPNLTLDQNRLQIIRFADPDPRYQTSPSLQKILYFFDDNRLIRRQYFAEPSQNIPTVPNQNSLSKEHGVDSILLTEIEGNWQIITNDQNSLSKDEPNSNKSNQTPKTIKLTFKKNTQNQNTEWLFNTQP